MTLHGKYGRLRTVVAAPDGALWLTTSNKDGKGKPVPADERVLRIVPTGGDGNNPPLMRIVSLLPSATEIVYALGLDGDLAGVTFECDEPARARQEKAIVVGGRDTSAMTPGEIDDYVRAQAAAGADLYHLHRDALAGVDPELILTQDLCWVCALPVGHGVRRPGLSRLLGRGGRARSALAGRRARHDRGRSRRAPAWLIARTERGRRAASVASTP